MTKNELEEIQYRLNTLLTGKFGTKPPWICYDGNGVRAMEDGKEIGVGIMYNTDDALFVAHAPDDISNLLNEIARLKEPRDQEER